MTHRNASFGIILMIAATVFVALGWTGVKILGEHLAAPQIVFFRALVGFAILVPLAKMRIGSLKAHNRKLLTIRGILGCIGMMLAFYAMTKMALGNASILLNTFPLFVALLSPFLLKEPSNPRVFILAIVAFIGIGLVLKPDAGMLRIPALAGLAAGVAVALAMISIRKLHMTDNTWVISIWFSAIVTIGSAPFIFIDFALPTMREWIIILLVGCTLTMSQLLLTKAFRYTSAEVIAPFSYLSVLWSYMADILIWNKVPDLWSAAGAAIIIGAGVGIIILSRKPIVRAGATS